ncbi:MAG: hypothetical protein AB7L65_07900 [Hyphomonadaceae bacterium]
MAIPAGKAPILESVSAAIGLWRAALPRVWPYALAGGLLIVGLDLASAGQPGAGLVLQLLSVAAMAFVYNLQLELALENAPRAWGARLASWARLFAAMAIIGFFLMLFFFVLLIPGMGILTNAAGVTPAQMEALGDDPAAMMQFAQTLVQEHWQVALALTIFYGAVWLLVTSRLYVAAPASVAETRIRTFETWPWTKDNMLRICAMRIVLLGPILVVTWILLTGLVSVLGADQMREPGVAFVARGAMQVFSLLVASGLEAALSAYLYKGLRPSQ